MIKLENISVITSPNACGQTAAGSHEGFSRIIIVNMKVEQIIPELSK
jgi:hypothetical protein